MQPAASRPRRPAGTVYIALGPLQTCSCWRPGGCCGHGCLRHATAPWCLHGTSPWERWPDPCQTCASPSGSLAHHLSRPEFSRVLLDTRAAEGKLLSREAGATVCIFVSVNPTGWVLPAPRSPADVLITHLLRHPMFCKALCCVFP